MTDRLLVSHCAPTLAGLKTGSLFTASFETGEDLRRSLRRVNKLLGEKGVRAVPLRYQKGRGLIYLYRPGQLSRDLRNPQVWEVLRACGYRKRSAGACLACLMKRLKEGEGFPHEIGLFLGYPPEDVAGFIENRAEHYKCSGLWKVYGDVEAARRRFDLYRECTRVYCRRWETGAGIQGLTVTG